MKKFTAIIAAVAATGATSANAMADFGWGSRSYEIGISGFVPVICRATLHASIVPVGSGEVNFGELNEFCNSPRGYQVFVDSSPELANASLQIDGAAIEIDDSGSTLISSSAHANFAVRDVALTLPEGTEGGSLSIRIVAL
jgi:hypothetical protein